MPIPTYVSATSTDGPNATHTPPSIAKVRKKAAKGKTLKAITSSRIDLSTQIFDAVLQEKERVVRRVLGSGIDPNLTNANGETPLMLACGIPDSDTQGSILACLLRHGADVNMQDYSGRTALMRAVTISSAETVKILVDANCSLEIEDCNGNNALSHAALQGEAEIVRKIVTEFKKRSISVDKCNMRGLTPLLIACQEGHVESAQILIEVGGASPSIRDLDNFMTAADWLRLSGRCSSPAVAFLSISPRKKYHRHHDSHAATSRPCAGRSLDYHSSIDELETRTASLRPEKRMHRRRSREDREALPQICTSTTMHAQSEFARTYHVPTELAQSTFLCKSNPKEAATSSSMFDVPSLSKVTSPHHSHSKLVPMPRPVSPPTERIIYSKSFKNDLYTSAFLTRRKSYAQIDRNHRSICSHGALEPLDINPQERLRQLTAQSTKNEHTAPTRHNTLPPLKRRNSNLKTS